MDQPGFLGTGASLISDLTLVAYLLLILPAMLVGFVFARRRLFVPHHRLTMTAITLVNWVLIAFLMVVSYRDGVAPYLTSSLSDARVLLPTLHLVTGALAQLLATYLVFRMWFERVLPPWFMVRNIKRYMRLTLSLWIVTVGLGALIYLTWYVPVATAGNSPAGPVSTPEAEPLATVELVATEDAVMPIPVSTEDAALVPAMTQDAVFAPAVTDEAVPAPVQTAEPEPEDDSGQGRGRGRGRGGDEN